MITGNQTADLNVVQQTDPDKDKKVIAKDAGCQKHINGRFIGRKKFGE